MLEDASGELTAWHYLTRHPVRVCWNHGMVSSISRCDHPPSDDVWMAPSLFDLQVNGYAGVDFQQDGLTTQELLQAASALRRDGCASFLLTLITDRWHCLTARLRHLRALRSQSAELKSAIAGWHVEGPFLSSQPGFHGAHNPDLMLDPTSEHIKALREITGSDLLMLTLAPERAGAIPAIDLAVSLGIKVSLGHTDVSPELLVKAIEAGASSFTHLGNGCTAELNRHDNILWRVLDSGRLRVSLIPDQIHVPAPLFRLVHRALPSGTVYYVTDAMSAAGSPAGQYKLGGLLLEVGADGVVRRPGQPYFAGSSLTPIQGVFSAAQMLGSSWQESWQRFSEIPAAVIGASLSERGPLCLLKMEQAQLKNLKVLGRPPAC
jgi:N-acetylglucosamine-6-phosphate deacetylase